MSYFNPEASLIMSLALLCSCTLANGEGNLFSLSEAKESHPAIYETVAYWENNRLRVVLPVENKVIATGFILEYGNSGFKDYRSIIGIDAGNRVRVFIDQRESVLTDEDTKKLKTIFEVFGDYARNGKNVNYYAKDGNIYLLTLITLNGVFKIPYYAPNLDEKNKKVDEVSLLKNILLLDKKIRDDQKR